MSYEKLTEDQKFAWEWQYRRLGGFKLALAGAIARADTYNQEKLAKSFPEETLGIVSYQSVEGYWNNILTIMKEK